MDEREIADWAICAGIDCGMPNIIWQPWRKLFRCGWCRRDYTRKKAQKLSKLTDVVYNELKARRESIIAGAIGPRRKASPL